MCGDSAKCCVAVQLLCGLPTVSRTQPKRVVKLQSPHVCVASAGDVAVAGADRVVSCRLLALLQNTDMENTQSLMNQTLGNMNKLLESGGSGHMCMLIVFVVLVFLVLYYVVSWR